MVNVKFGDLKTQAAKINNNEAKTLFEEYLIKLIAVEMLRIEKEKTKAKLILKMEEDLLVMKFEKIQRD
jgi:hypothetical protein